jgi:hypothetical protein
MENNIEQPTLYVSLTPYTDELLRDWLFTSVKADKIPFESVATIGAGPFEET